MSGLYAGVKPPFTYRCTKQDFPTLLGPITHILTFFAIGVSIGGSSGSSESLEIRLPIRTGEVAIEQPPLRCFFIEVQNCDKFVQKFDKLFYSSADGEKSRNIVRLVCEDKTVQ